ncbi:MAG TPA: ATP synthase F0 subunit B [Bacteroidetes bacterium]|nr:ATP synthase F0 subunit B [Bacteroidota bacterium]
MELLTPNTGLMFWTVVTFLVLLLVLRKTAWGPLLRVLDEREQRIRESLEKAEIAQKQADEAISKQEELLAKAREEAQEIIARSKNMAEALKGDIVSKARAEADNLLDRAKREIALEREKAVDELRRLAVDLSITATKKVIGKALTEKDHEKIVSESLQEMGDLN